MITIYEQLWHDAAAAFARGEPLLDPHLPDKIGDLRRGVTLAWRPSLPVQNCVRDFATRLAADFPGQYHYQPEELHVTVLAIISGSELWRKEIRHLAAYRAIIADVLSRHRSFKLGFRGVTASPGAVLIQGFTLDDELADIRADLRREFTRAGFGNILDRRYPIRTAHMTLMRFCRQNTDWPRLAAWLQAHRQTDFGEMNVTTLQLLWGDWYASANIERTLQEYPLAGPAKETAG